MTPDEDMALKFAVVALRTALLKRAVLSHAEIDVELGDIFAKIAIDKTLGSTLLEGSGSTLLRLSTMREPSCTRAIGRSSREPAMVSHPSRHALSPHLRHFSPCGVRVGIVGQQGGWREHPELLCIRRIRTESGV